MGEHSSNQPCNGSLLEAANGLQMAVGIEVTRHCNLRCPHCFTASGGNVARDPDPELLRQLFAELATAGVRSLAFTGGEPLIRRDFPQLLRSAKATGIDDLGLVTNGFQVKPALAHELYEAGLRTVQISVDGVDAIDHCAVRGCETRDFYRAVRALRLFMDAGLNVYVATIVSPRNVQRAPEMILLCEALGVHGLRYCTFVPTGRAANTDVASRYAVEPERLDEFLAFLRQMNQQPGAHLRVAVDHGMGPWHAGGEFHCESGKRVAYVSCNGDLYPCPALCYESLRVGNVYETPISQLLNSPALSVARCVPRQRIQGACATCSNQHCSGGCRGVAYARAGTLAGAVPYCNFYRSASKSA